MDTISKAARSGVMRLVKDKETRLEKAFRSQLWRRGVRYRKNNPTLYGKPDVSIASKKVVVFIDSCFWHGCRNHLRLPKSNVEYWRKKIEKNAERDSAVNRYYNERGWRLMRIWEHDLKKDEDLVVETVIRAAAGKN